MLDEIDLKYKYLFTYDSQGGPLEATPKTNVFPNKLSIRIFVQPKLETPKISKIKLSLPIGSGKQDLTEYASSIQYKIESTDDNNEWNICREINSGDIIINPNTPTGLAIPNNLSIILSNIEINRENGQGKIVLIEETGEKGRLQTLTGETAFDKKESTVSYNAKIVSFSYDMIFMNIAYTLFWQVENAVFCRLSFKNERGDMEVLGEYLPNKMKGLKNTKKILPAEYCLTAYVPKEKGGFKEEALKERTVTATYKITFDAIYWDYFLSGRAALCKSTSSIYFVESSFVCSTGTSSSSLLHFTRTSNHELRFQGRRIKLSPISLMHYCKVLFISIACDGKELYLLADDPYSTEERGIFLLALDISKESDYYESSPPKFLLTRKNKSHINVIKSSIVSNNKHILFCTFFGEERYLIEINPEKWNSADENEFYVKESKLPDLVETISLNLEGDILYCINYNHNLLQARNMNELGLKLFSYEGTHLRLGGNSTDGKYLCLTDRKTEADVLLVFDARTQEKIYTHKLESKIRHAKAIPLYGDFLGVLTVNKERKEKTLCGFYVINMLTEETSAITDFTLYELGMKNLHVEDITVVIENSSSFFINFFYNKSVIALTVSNSLAVTSGMGEESYIGNSSINTSRALFPPMRPGAALPQVSDTNEEIKSFINAAI